MRPDSTCVCPLQSPEQGLAQLATAQAEKAAERAREEGQRVKEAKAEAEAQKAEVDMVTTEAAKKARDAARQARKIASEARAKAQVGLATSWFLSHQKSREQAMGTGPWTSLAVKHLCQRRWYHWTSAFKGNFRLITGGRQGPGWPRGVMVWMLGGGRGVNPWHMANSGLVSASTCDRGPEDPGLLVIMFWA